MEIEVGDYCRTKQGYIAKIIEIRDDYIEFDNTIIRSYGEEYDYLHDDEIEEIAKHSKNIIDLIEVGDYVNGEKIVAVDYSEDENGNYFDILGTMEIDDDFAYPIILKNEDIKSIVTKQKFKEMEYRVDE